jgi:hypothetical protein
MNEVESQFVKDLDLIKLPVNQDQELEDKMNKLEDAATEMFNKRCDRIEKDTLKTYLEKLKTRIGERKESKLMEN